MTPILARHPLAKADATCEKCGGSGVQAIRYGGGPGHHVAIICDCPARAISKDTTARLLADLEAAGR